MPIKSKVNITSIQEFPKLMISVDDNMIILATGKSLNGLTGIVLDSGRCTHSDCTAGSIRNGDNDNYYFGLMFFRDFNGTIELSNKAV